MENVEEQILSYPHLSAEKKREVEAYVESNPRWAPLLRDIRAVESFGLGNGIPANVQNLLRAYVVAQHVEQDRSDSFDEVFASLEHALDDGGDLEARVDTIRERLKRAEATLDPVSHFESLTGRSLPPEPSSTDAPSSISPSRDDPRAAPSLLDRFLGLPRVLQGGGVALTLLLVTYVALFAASWASQSPLDRMATVDVSGQMVESYYSTNTRGAAPAADGKPASSLYLQTLLTLRNARTSTFGLFPHYHADSLQKATDGLERVVDRTDPRSFLALEARFYLGKIHLAQRDLAEARDCFQIVVEEDGRRAEDARQILQTLETTYPDRLELELDSSSTGELGFDNGDLG